MSVCIEQNHHNNFSQSLPTCNEKQFYSADQIIKKVKFWMERSHQRKQLAQLDDLILDDIGLSREQVDKETSLPFWK